MAVFSGNGSVSAPSFTFSSDTDTGMYRGAEDQIFFAAGGARNFYIRDDEAGSDVPFIGFDEAGPAITSRFGTGSNTTTSQTRQGLLIRNADSRMNGTSYTTSGLDIRSELAFGFLDTGANTRTLATVVAKNTSNVTGGAVKPKADLIFQTTDADNNSTTLVDRVQITNSGNLIVGGTLPSSPNASISSNGQIDATGYVTGRYYISETINFSGVSSVSYNLSSIPGFPTGSFAFSVEILVNYIRTSSVSSSSIIHGRRAPNGTWSFATISNLGSNTATGSGSGTTITVSFSANAQFGSMSIKAMYGASA